MRTKEYSRRKRMKFTIERGVKLPPHQSPRTRIWLALLFQMEVGDSVLVGSKTQAMSMFMAAKRYRMKVTIRTMPEGVRVWRTK